jgi:hypothetical protein
MTVFTYSTHHVTAIGLTRGIHHVIMTVLTCSIHHVTPIVLKHSKVRNSNRNYYRTELITLQRYIQQQLSRNENY